MGEAGSGEVVYLVHLDIERERHVVTHQLEARMIEQSADRRSSPGKKIVDAQHLVAGVDQTLAEMAAEKAGAPVTRTRRGTGAECSA